VDGNLHPMTNQKWGRYMSCAFVKLVGGMAGVGALIVGKLIVVARVH